MSRVGKVPIEIPKAVKIALQGNSINVEGPNGKLSLNIHHRIKAEAKDSQLIVKRPSDLKSDMALHGLMRNLIFNMVKGVTEGFQKELEIQGVGYKAQLKGKELVLNLGFSHQIEFPIPEGITIEAPKPTQLVVKGADKQLVGETAAKIRRFYPPEPYKGKGIRYKGEYVRRKAGKAVA